MPWIAGTLDTVNAVGRRDKVNHKGQGRVSGRDVLGRQDLQGIKARFEMVDLVIEIKKAIAIADAAAFAFGNGDGAILNGDETEQLLWTAIKTGIDVP